MTTVFTTLQARYSTIEYQLNIESGWYDKMPCRIPFLKLPDRLKFEKTRENKILSNGAQEIITGPVRNKKRTFFTGIIPLQSFGWYEGNQCEFRTGGKSISLVLFRLSNGERCMTVHFFNGWYIPNKEKRMEFCNNFAQSIDLAK
jgi:hypothetical protein